MCTNMVSLKQIGDLAAALGVRKHCDFCDKLEEDHYVVSNKEDSSR